MDNINDYLTINEFAKLANVSRQAVYKRVDKDLTTYCKVIDNKKMLSKEALELFVSTDCKGKVDKFTKNSQPVEQPVDNGLQGTLDTLNSTINLLKSQLENQYEQLKCKDKQILDLQEQIKTLSQLLQQSNELNKNNQVLLAQINQKQLNTNEETIADKQTSEKKPWWKRKK